MKGCRNLDHDAALEIVIKVITLTKLGLGSWKMKTLPEGTKRPKISTLVFLPFAISEGLRRLRRALEIKFGIKYELGSNKSTILLAGRRFNITQLVHLSSLRFTKPPMPSGIAMSQKRNNSLCGMMVHAKYENERRITVFLLSGSSSSCSQELTLRLVRALQSPSPSDIANGQK